jgi:hypothetical protein
VSSWDTNWVLVEGRYYLVKIFVFDKEKRNISLTSNLVFKTTVDGTYLEIVKRN